MSEDEHGYSRGSRGSERDEDYRPHSRHPDESERYGGRAMARGYYDDDERYGRRGEGRGHGGWFGDSEGHSETSRRGWSEGHMSQRRGEDERYYRGRSGNGENECRRAGRYEDERYSRGHGGWSGDPEGHSEASRRGWERRR